MASTLMTATFALLLTACGPQDSPLQQSLPPLTDPFVSDVMGITEKHLSPDHWVASSSRSKILMTAAEIHDFNARNIAAEKTLYNLASLPQNLSRDDLLARIRSISNVPKYPRIYSDGTPVTQKDFSRYEASLNLEAIKENNMLRFAMAVRRTPLRTYPTLDLLFSSDADNRDIERFQESTLFPADIAVILHESVDGNWSLIQSNTYIAWVQNKDIAVGARADILAYKAAKDFLLVTGDKIHTTYNPEVPEVSELQLDMGVRLPLDRPEEFQHNLYGQNPYLSHMVKLPIRQPDGSLAFRHALISRAKDVHVGYLPFTEENIIRQAFKFLGERYGWGHRYNGRDCTGFVSEVYKSFGILLPRNSGDQARSPIGQNTRFDKDTPRDVKHTVLHQSRVGDMVYMPGHVMMILGQSDGQPFVIHDVTGLGYMQQDGSIYKGTLNGVSITPIIPLQSNPKRTYVDTVSNIKSIR
ncbi:hypothetical protein CRD36_10265 [Paremcibacter congregatus]|uniref:NlpC/P60 domain-containing protein n=2 Tax=Paremcibacter congregatus TaxID=2043170 RepID=A0A2G4YR23_9PROT|nr:hypothetical protein CRD36_10265 [Paremcibacter congregatus]QDE29332.1 hypothetical protein FIV45_17035 [Paremcibacter congregatus]